MTLGAIQTAAAVWLAASTCVTTSGCHRSTPLHVTVHFATAWQCAGRGLSEDERSIVKRTMFETLHAAFTGFDVRFDEGSAADRMLKIEDTPYTRRSYFGSAGITYPASNTSGVRLDVLCAIEAGLIGCRDFARCTTRSLTDILAGLGRALASTAAHELGHQQGLHFTNESACADCYDSRSATTMVHFFGEKHWSTQAVTRMRAVLPRTP